MSVDLKGAKNIGFKWAVWSYEKGDWDSVSAEKPDGAPADAIFSMDAAIEMQAKGIEPRRRGGGPAQQAAPPMTQAPYVPPMIPQASPAPTVQRMDKPASFFSLPSAEKLAEQQKIYQAAQAQQEVAAQAQRQPQQPARQASALPTIKPTRAEIITPAVAGGIAMGVIMGIPIANLCVPAWFLGGILATFLLLAESPIRSTLAPEDAAKVGAVAGLVGAVVSLIVSFVAIVFAGEAVISAAGGNSSQLTLLVLNAMGVDNDLDIYFVLFSLVSRAVLFPLFGALGAVLYVRYGRKG